MYVISILILYIVLARFDLDQALYSLSFFRIRIKIRLKKNYFTYFKTYYNYLTIDCRYLIKYILQIRFLGILSFFMKEKVNFIVSTVMKI